MAATLNLGKAIPKKGVDYWTAEDKAEIIAEVLAALGNPTVFGYVDEYNNIILSGNLADDTYSVKYEMEDGTTVAIGKLVLDSNVYYSITNSLTNCTNSNGATQVVEGGSYSATISATSGYELSSVKVTMGGTDITSSAVSSGTISIASVTGNIVITAVAKKVEVVNQIPISTDASGNVLGIKSGYRLSLSSGGETAASGYYCTGFIPVKVNDVIRIKNIDLTNENSTNIICYDSSKNPYRSVATSGGYGTTLYNLFVTIGTNDGSVYTATLKQGLINSFEDGLAYIRIGSKSITDNSVLTVNQEIT